MRGTKEKRKHAPSSQEASKTKRSQVGERELESQLGEGIFLGGTEGGWLREEGGGLGTWS